MIHNFVGRLLLEKYLRANMYEKCLVGTGFRGGQIPKKYSSRMILHRNQNVSTVLTVDCMLLLVTCTSK
jgi:hypothetical protein